MQLPVLAGSVRRTTRYVGLKQRTVVTDAKRKHFHRGRSIAPQTFGGGTYQCNCPSGSTTCNSNQNCVCDFWGAHCV